MEPPWARTADGEVVPTSFSVDGDRLIQSVDIDDLEPSAFPVSADPTVHQNCGWITCTWYFSVTRSRQLAEDSLTSRGSLVAGFSSTMACSLVAMAAAGAPGFNLLVSLLCFGLSTAVLRSYASNLHDARRRGRCFTVSTPPRGLFGNVPLSNTYCHK